MMPPAKPRAHSRMRWWLLSMVIPLPAGALFAVMELVPRIGQGLNGYAGMLLLVLLYLGVGASTLAGVVCALCSMVLDRPRWPGAAGLALNLAFAAWVFGGG